MDAARFYRFFSPRPQDLWELTAIAIALFSLGIWIVNLTYYYPFFADDGFISLRYAQRLLEGKGLTWTDGEKVEGYSNFAYVLLTAFFGVVFDLITAARIVGILGVACLILAIVRAGQNFSPTSKMAVPLTCMICASTSAFAIWAIGGLEATLLLGLVAVAYVEFSLPHTPRSSKHSQWIASACLGLACWTRPDAPLFVVWLVVWELGKGRLSPSARKRSISVCSLPVLAWISQTGFRLIYYGDWIPNTARVKAEFETRRLETGLDYISSSFEGSWWLVGLAGLALYAAWHDKHRRAQISLAVGGGLIWLAYVIVIGGDIFPGWRHAVPCYGLFAIAGLWGIEWLLMRAEPQATAGQEDATTTKSGRGGIVVVSLSAAASLFVAQRNDPGNQFAKTERWEWAAEPVGRLYRRFLDRDPLMAIEPAGALPYFSRLRSLDMYGLCDRHIAMTSSRAGWALAHDHGDGNYVWERQPDLMVFRMPWGESPASVSGMELHQRSDFKDNYPTIHFFAIDPFDVRANSQIRKNGRLGIQQNDDEVIVPGYLFQGSHVIGHAIANGKVGALAQDAAGGYSPTFRLSPGRWKLHSEDLSPWLQIYVRNREASNSSVLVRDQTIQLKTNTLLDMRVSSPSRIQGELGPMTWTRIDDNSTFDRAKTIRLKQQAVLIEPSMSISLSLKSWQPHPLNEDRKGFVNEDRSRKLARSNAHPKCRASTFDSTWIDQSIRINTYSRKKGDLWTGKAHGPSFVVPPNALAYVCISGANHSAGLRLRLTDTDEIIRSWLGTNSANPIEYTSDLSHYVGRPAKFEVYDRNTGGWGHIQIHALGVATPKS